MGVFNNWPYTDVHQLNLDFILDAVKDYKEKAEELDAAVETATTAAENAETSANRAEIMKNNAQIIREETAEYYELTKVLVGKPLAANTAAEMTDTTTIYVYTGNEPDMEPGHWYYYNGAEWADGGVYGADGGISNRARALLKYVLDKAAYIEIGMDIYVNALIEALAGDTPTGATFNIVNVLTNVTNTNGATEIPIGESYTAQLVADNNYVITSVIITMGGLDITSTAYNNGNITIASVTGDVIITASATDADVLPSGYTKVDYLTKAANVNDAIETDLYQSPTFGVLDCNFEFAMTGSGSANEQGFGCRLSEGATTATSEYAIFFGRSDVGAFRSTTFGTNSQVDIGTYSQNTWHTVQYRYNNGAPYFVLDGGTPVSVPNPPSIIEANNTVPLRLCGINNNNNTPQQQAVSTGYARWGKVTYYSNGNKVFNFVPAYNGATYGYYETVNGVWYPSARGFITGGNLS